MAPFFIPMNKILIAHLWAESGKNIVRISFDALRVVLIDTYTPEDILGIHTELLDAAHSAPSDRAASAVRKVLNGYKSGIDVQFLGKESLL